MRNLLNLKNFAQINISELLGISRNAYSKIERDQTDPSHSRLEKIAAIFEIPVVGLLCFGENQQSENAGIFVKNNVESKVNKLELEVSQLRGMMEILILRK